MPCDFFLCSPLSSLFARMWLRQFQFGTLLDDDKPYHDIQPQLQHQIAELQLVDHRDDMTYWT
jgi:hypothetical protein